MLQPGSGIASSRSDRILELADCRLDDFPRHRSLLLRPGLHYQHDLATGDGIANEVGKPAILVFDTCVGAGRSADKSPEAGPSAQHDERSDQRAGDEKADASSHQRELGQRADTGTDRRPDGAIDQDVGQHLVVIAFEFGNRRTGFGIEELHLITRHAPIGKPRQRAFRSCPVGEKS